MRLALLSRALTTGGAQVQICALARGLAQRGHDAGVVTFYVAAVAVAIATSIFVTLSVARLRPSLAPA